MDVRRKQNESIGALLRRFSRLVQNSHVIINAKSNRYFKKKLTERQERGRALMGVSLRQLRKRLERMGQYDDETFELEKKKVKLKLNF